MTPYFLTLTLMITSVLFFSPKTEQSRVVTIHRPLVITQERKTPAYYAYQQSQNLLHKKTTAPVQNSIYLSNLSLVPETAKIQIAEMKFTKREFAAIQPNYSSGRTLASDLTEETMNLAYEKVVYSNSPDSPLFEQDSAVPELSPSKKWATIKGKFELVEGVGIVDHIIELKRVEEGRIREVGRIDLKAGTYSIDIESPQGVLIAQIRDRSGFIIGEDRQRLINLHSRGSFFEGPFMRVGRPDPLAVNPAYSDYRGAASRFATASTKAITTAGLAVSLFDGQKMLANPNDELSNISRFSSSIARVFDPSQTYKNITTIRLTGDKSQTPMFTKKWIDGVVEYISDMQKIEFRSKNAPIIIGKVMVGGDTLAGAQVEIENKPGIIPIYFDQFMIPALNQSETSQNGYFMFVGIETDSYRIVATKNNRLVGNQIFIAEEDSAGFQHIESHAVPHTKILRSFDAFNSEPVETEIITADLEEPLETRGGTASFRTTSAGNVAEFLIRTPDRRYLPIRYVQSGQRDFVHLPLIQEAWLNEVKTFKQINELPATGTIIGFTTDLTYSAYLAVDAYNSNNVVYFDKTGRVSVKPVTGGGFILFNVPIGAREVVLQENGSERLHSQVAEIKSQQITVTHFSE